MQKKGVFNMNTEKMLVYLPLYCNINDASMLSCKADSWVSLKQLDRIAKARSASADDIRPKSRTQPNRKHLDDTRF